MPRSRDHTGDFYLPYRRRVLLYHWMTAPTWMKNNFINIFQDLNKRHHATAATNRALMSSSLLLYSLQF